MTQHPYMNYIEKGLNSYINDAFQGKKTHIDYFFKCKCAGDLLNLQVFPNAKEITESMGAFIAAKKHIKIPFDNPSITLYVIADGCTPRTGALFAFLTHWNIFSIDPNMHDKWTHPDHGINRLTCLKSKIEDLPHSTLPHPDLLILVHPHVDYITIRSLYPTPPIIVIPCCIQYPRDLTHKTYTDHGIWSIKNEVYIFEGDCAPFENPSTREEEETELQEHHN